MIVFKKSTKHPGFKAVASQIAAKQGISKESASAILAASSRNASRAAHKANPRLNRVKKSIPMGALFEAAQMLPRMIGGGYDWDSPQEKTFVMIRIHNKNSKLHDRYIILERTEHGYKIARQNDKKDDDQKNEKKHPDEVEKLEKDIDTIEKSFTKIRSLRRTPQKSSSRRFTSVSVAKSVYQLKNALKKLQQ